MAGVVGMDGMPLLGKGRKRWCGQATEATDVNPKHQLEVQEYLQLADQARAVEEVRKERLKRHGEALEEAESKVRLLQRQLEDLRGQQEQDASNLQSELSQRCSELEKLQAKRISLSQEPEKRLCIACVTQPADQIFLPCGHINYCRDCAVRHLQARSFCPSCRRQVKGRRTARYVT